MRMWGEPRLTSGSLEGTAEGTAESRSLEHAAHQDRPACGPHICSDCADRVSLLRGCPGAEGGVGESCGATCRPKRGWADVAREAAAVEPPDNSSERISVGW